MSASMAGITVILNYLATLMILAGFFILCVMLWKRKPKTARLAAFIGAGHACTLLASLLFRLALSQQWIDFPFSEPFDFQTLQYVLVIWVMSLPMCLIWLAVGYAILEQPDRSSAFARRD